MTKVTIEDISRHTGLSRGTVSRALNDRPDISEQTKQKVLQACRELKYVPSHAARSLATGRRYAVAVVVDSLDCALSCAVLRGVISRARAERYVVHVSELGGEPEDALGHLMGIINERVDGVLLAGPLPRDAVNRISAAAGERVLIGCTAMPAATCDTLAPDHAEAGRLAARHMLACAQNDPNAVLYVYDEDDEAEAARRGGFHEACRMIGGNPESLTVRVPAAENGAAHRFDDLRGRLPQVRGVVASNDLLAVEILVLAVQAGRQPGRDLAIMGQGNDQLGRRISPGLTTIDYNGEEIGRRAIDLAFQRISKMRHDTAQHVLVAPTLIERDSTKTRG